MTGDRRRRYHLPAEVTMPEDRLPGEDGRRLAAALRAAMSQAVRESTAVRDSTAVQESTTVRESIEDGRDGGNGPDSAT